MVQTHHPPPYNAEVMELVDITDLDSVEYKARAGSTPAFGTKKTMREWRNGRRASLRS